MLASHQLACPHCGRTLKLDEAHSRVPYRRRHWWQFGDERSEFHCRECKGFSVLRLSRFGLALYAAEAAVVAVLWNAGLSRAGILAAGAVLTVMLFRHATQLFPSH